MNPQNAFGHINYILVILSVSMSSMRWLRIFAIASGLTGILYYGFIVSDEISAMWEAIFTLVNVVQLAIILLAGRRRVASRSIGAPPGHTRQHDRVVPYARRLGPAPGGGGGPFYESAPGARKRQRRRGPSLDGGIRRLLAGSVTRPFGRVKDLAGQHAGSYPL